MATVTIKLEDSLVERLSQRAKQMNCNLQKYIAEMLAALDGKNQKATTLPSDASSFYRTSDFIDSLVVKGEYPVPADLNGIDSLLDEKYLQ